MFHVNSNLQRFKNLTQYMTVSLQDNNSDNLSMAAKGMQRGGGGYMVRFIHFLCPLLLLPNYLQNLWAYML